jgi:hypothetical protein
MAVCWPADQPPDSVTFWNWRMSPGWQRAEELVWPWAIVTTSEPQT